MAEYASSGSGDLALRAVFSEVESLTRHFQMRDMAASQVRSMRKGDFEQVAPGSFSQAYPRPIIANRIDTMSRDMAASLTPLPSFTCASSSMLTDSAKKFAETRTKIAHNYVHMSRLQAQMPDGADSYNAYGIFAATVEPDFVTKQPKIRILDGASVYPVWDRDLNVSKIAQVYHLSRNGLLAQYPDAQKALTDHPGGCVNDKIKVVKYSNSDRVICYLPDLGNHVLHDVKNVLGRPPFVCVPRPSGDGSFTTIPRGAYDDLVWPLLAANEFRMLALEATDKAVRAPVVVPPDVTDVPYGPDATVRTNNPQGVRRLEMTIPPSAFQASEILDQDIQVGGMSPSSRAGQLDGSVVTGRGVEALSAGYSTQVASAQHRLSFALELLVSMCFEMDEKLWGTTRKKISGKSQGVPFELSYTPAKDINSDYQIEVDYGFLVGLDANRALVFILQAQAAGLISNDTAARQLPISLNVADEQKKIEIEQMRNALIQSSSAIVQSIPQLVLNGQDPRMVVLQAAQITAGLKKGREIEDVVQEVYAPPAPPEAAAPGSPGASPQDAAAPPGPGGGGAPSGPLNIATEGPNAKPDLSMLFAGLTAGGNPNLGSVVSRRNPVAGQ